MKSILFNKKGEGHIDTGVKIIIAVVIGALILSALYFLFSGEDGIMGKLNNEVEGMSKEQASTASVSTQESKTTAWKSSSNA